MGGHPTDGDEMEDQNRSDYKEGYGEAISRQTARLLDRCTGTGRESRAEMIGGLDGHLAARGRSLLPLQIIGRRS